MPSIKCRDYHDNDHGDEDNEEDESIDGTGPALPNILQRKTFWPVLERRSNHGINEPHNSRQAHTTPVLPTAATETTEINPPIELTQPSKARYCILVVRKLKLNEFCQSLEKVHQHYSIAVQRNEV